MSIPLIGPIIGVISEVGRQWGQARIEKAKAEVVIAKKRAEAAAQIDVSKVMADINWDIAQAEASKNSWKDEFWTVVLSIPLVMCFIPGLEVYVSNGFTVLRDSVPEWYIVAVGAAISAAFGFRKLSEVINKRDH